MSGTNPLTQPLPADLPENWNNSQTITAFGVEVGLSPKHGYNYLMAQVNAAQQAANAIGEAFPDLATTQDLQELETVTIPEIIQQEAVSLVGSVVLPAAAWQQDPVSQLYSQLVTIPGLTADSKVDFDAGLDMAQKLPAPIYPVNNNGILTAVTPMIPNFDVQLQVTVINIKAAEVN